MCIRDRPYRVEQKTDYDKLVLEVTTDGSISPKDALKEAAKILIDHFMLFSDEKITLETHDQESNQEFDEEVLHMRQLLKTRLVDMNLSAVSYTHLDVYKSQIHDTGNNYLGCRKYVYPLVR